MAHESINYVWARKHLTDSQDRIMDLLNQLDMELMRHGKHVDHIHTAAQDLMGTGNVTPEIIEWLKTNTPKRAEQFSVLWSRAESKFSNLQRIDIPSINSVADEMQRSLQEAELAINALPKTDPVVKK